MTGKNATRVLKWSSDSVAIGIVHESDIKPEMRTLIDLYDDSDEVSINHCIFYFDIEVERGLRYSTPDEATNTITSISFYDTISKRYSCFILDKQSRIDPNQFDSVEIVTFKTERDLLMKFVERWNETPITIVSGWNCLWFDLLYLYNRIERVLGQYYGKWLSPIKKVDNYTTKRGDRVFRIGGISILDYMQLYREHTYSEEASYTLNDICLKELKRGKIQYEKDLDHLYMTDPVKFIEYNIEDVKLVVDLDAKLDFIAITQGICHAGHVPYEDIFFTSRYMEGACLTETKRCGVVAIKSNLGGGEKAVGAFVKIPKPGLYRWTFDLDLSSLYPSNIISMNISPETKWGKILNWDSDEFVKGTEKKYKLLCTKECDFLEGVEIEYDVQELKDYLRSQQFTISANGIVYDKSSMGLIPRLIDRWLAERAEFRRLASQAFDAGDMELNKYYDRKQKIKKVQANSLYGVLLLPIFRFYDRDNGEAVTTTGQQVNHFTTSIANYYYNKEMGTEGIDYCLYSDTDSIFYEALPIINKRYGDVPEDAIPDLTVKVATDFQNFINESYNMYAREFHLADSHRWNIKQELVARRAFWGNAKKRYAMWIVRKGDLKQDEPDIKGFDSVRSDFAKLFRKFLEEILLDILHDKDAGSLNDKIIEFKSKMKEYDVFDLLRPSAVKDMEKWKPEPNVIYKKGTPIHVKSAMNYNYFLDDRKIKSSPRFESGDKIKWGYLSDNPYNFETIAIRGYDDPDEVMEFLNKYINRDKIFDHALVDKLQNIWDNLGWGRFTMNKNISKFFDFS